MPNCCKASTLEDSCLIREISEHRQRQNARSLAIDSIAVMGVPIQRHAFADPDFLPNAVPAGGLTSPAGFRSTLECRRLGALDLS